MVDAGMNALQALLEQIVLQDNVVGVLLVQDDGTHIAGAGDVEAVAVHLIDADPDELEHFERDALGATAIAPGALHGVRCQHLIGGKLRLALAFELDADLDTIKTVGQQAGLETMNLFKQLRRS